MADKFVDFDAGNNGNSGDDQDNAWRNLPGDAVSSPGSLGAGDTVWIKGGTTASSGTHGHVAVSPTYYGANSSIAVHATWGTGDANINMAGVSVPIYLGAINVTQDGLTLKGASDTKRLNIYGAQSGGDALLMLYSADNITLEYTDVYNAQSFGCGVGLTNNTTINYCNFHTNNSLGLTFGIAGDAQNLNFTVNYSNIYGNGVTAGDLAQGGHITGQQTGVFNWCDFYNNNRDGCDVGIAQSGGSVNYNPVVYFVNCDFYGNGEDGIGCNDQSSNSGQVTVISINCRIFNNATGVQAYDGVDYYSYHDIFHSNNGQTFFGGAILTYSGWSRKSSVTLRNTIFFYQNNWQVGGYAAPTNCSNIDSAGCLWVPRSSNSEVAWEWPWGYTYTYNDGIPTVANPGASCSATWTHDDVAGTLADPGFTATDNNVIANNDYTITALGPADSASGNSVGLSGFPTAALTDRNGVARSDPPEIGLYELVSGETQSPIASITHIRRFIGSML